MISDLRHHGMEVDELSWDSLPLDHFKLPLAIDTTDCCTDVDAPDIPPLSDLSIDSALPDDVFERIFSFLPIASVIRASLTCKRWHEIIHSRRRSLFCPCSQSKPWYFMFTCTNEASPGGFAFDPLNRKWFSFHLPCIEKSNWFVSTSSGLVCCMDSDSWSRVFVSNPITREWRQLPEPSGNTQPDYSTVAISVDKRSLDYIVSLARSKQVSDDFHQWEFVVHLYRSDSGKWITPVMEVFSGWRGGDDSVICNGLLYCLIQSTGVIANTVPRHRLIMYDILTASVHGHLCSSSGSLMGSSIPVPCALTCGRLMNLKDKLVMVGGIAKNDRPDIIKGIGIWELRENKAWREVAKMPHKYFQGFGELDDVFASSGSHESVYIQSYGSTALLVFDMEKKEWRWSARCPVSKRFPLQLFTGFCFEPRLEVSC
ncbi:hypothetical protein LUZ61_014086 [Rhynchospora tenuis]|uniref:F-box domain-containing protein n=1 Tax=Rhynchospora tenuis TaxID=198213 RepID=A0AAD5Z2C6_9POAL|nr:hypothetical protein LUZ61_014086 [Rhynchospora tenuis]